MTKLVWDAVNARRYNFGVSKGVLYPLTGPGVAWSGLTSVTKDNEGGEIEALYFEGMKFFELNETKNYSAVISGFSSPAEFQRCLGTLEIAPGYMLTGQNREAFAFSYQTQVDNGYHIHTVYNATVTQNEVEHPTLSDTIEPIEFSWNVRAVPLISSAHNPSAHYVIDSRTTPPATLTTLENQFYGTASTPPTLPKLDNIIKLLSEGVE